MKLETILKQFKKLSILKGEIQSQFSYVQSDSRKIQANDIFCVYSQFGEKTPGYLDDALKNGATAVLIRKNSPFIQKANQFPCVIQCSQDPMYFHGHLAHFMTGEPSLKCKIIAVTGTNGKTSLTYIISDILGREDISCGIIGTIQTRYSNKIIQTGYTTPEPSQFNLLLKDMVEEGVKYVIIEASSHGLKLGRLNGIHIQGAIFTNLTQDHMDFHPDRKDYLHSKYKLFQILSRSVNENKFAVVSYDSPGGEEMYRLINRKKPNFKVIRFGKDRDYEGNIKKLSLKGTDFTLKEKGKGIKELTTNLLGNFNMVNVSLSWIACRELQIDEESLHRSIDNLQPVPGRFQLIYNSKKTRVAVVDYAHTPDALLNILKSLSEIPHSKILTLFGCGGDRDRTKRPEMAKIASEYSDMVIITSDNPRTEDPEKILDDIEEGIPKKFKNYIRITSRRQAIQRAVAILPDEGILLVAGKGHENYQIIGTQRENFSDTIEIQNALALDESSRK